MILSFSWLAGCKPTAEELMAMPKEWFELNSYIKIGDNGLITLMAPNPEFGSNVKTSLPMMLAEDPFYVAHRGSGAEFPEHTMAAYEAALGRLEGARR